MTFEELESLTFEELELLTFEELELLTAIFDRVQSDVVERVAVPTNERNFLIFPNNVACVSSLAIFESDSDSVKVVKLSLLSAVFPSLLVFNSEKFPFISDIFTLSFAFHTFIAILYQPPLSAIELSAIIIFCELLIISTHCCRRYESD